MSQIAARAVCIVATRPYSNSNYALAPLAQSCACKVVQSADVATLQQETVLVTQTHRETAIISRTVPPASTSSTEEAVALSQLSRALCMVAALRRAVYAWSLARPFTAML